MDKSKKFYSSLQESAIAKYLNWTQTSGSGARPLYPGDIFSRNWLGECKTHESPGHSIVFVFDVWDKIEKEASSQFKNPALFVDDGSQSIEKTWVMFKLQNYDPSLKCNVLDCTKSKSIRVSNNSPSYAQAFLRNNQMYVVMNLEAFKQYLEYEDK